MIGYETTVRELVFIFALLTGCHYNLENIFVAVMHSKDKAYALGCLLPYAQFFAMMFASSYSQLYADYTVYFVILCGFFLTWVTAIFNLNSTAGARFNWLFFEPLVFFAFVYCDTMGIFDRNAAIAAYISFFVVTLVRYLMLMKNIVNQICSYMGLSFLKVKPRGKTRQD